VLLERLGATLIDPFYLLTDAKFPKRAVPRDLIVRHFWRDFQTIPEKERRQSILSTINEVLALMIDPMVRGVIGQPKSTFDLTAIARPGRSSPRPPRALAARRPLERMATSTSTASLRSHRRPRPSRSPPPAPRRARLRLLEVLLGACGTFVAFRLGPTDAERLRREFPPDNMRHDLVELPPHTAHARTPERTLADFVMPATFHPRFPKAPKEICSRSRRRYASQRRQVEEMLNKRA
jgi:hypothetical protein